MKNERDQRSKDLGLIHMGAAVLGMDTKDTNPDSEYHAMLWSIGRCRSAADLGHHGRQAVIEHLRSRGAIGARVGGGRGPNPEWGWVDRAAEDRRPMLRKIIMLAKSGGYSKKYVEGACGKMFGIERLELVAPDQLHKLVAALVKDRQRKAKTQ